MKKFLVSVLLCAGIVSSAYSMDEPLDLGKVLEACPDQIAWYLDRDSFSVLTQVCRLFQEICEAVPVKYLAVTFSDAAAHGREKLIDRFIAQPDGWIFELGMGEEVTIPQEDNEGNLKMLKLSSSEGLRGFLGDYSICHVYQNGKIHGYRLDWNDSVYVIGRPRAAFELHLQVDEQNGINGDLTTHKFRFLGPCCKAFKISAPAYSVDSFTKVLGIIAIFILAIQKNQIPVIYAILNNPRTLACLPSDILKAVNQIFDNGHAIKDVVSAVLFERQMAALKISK